MRTFFVFVRDHPAAAILGKIFREVPKWSAVSLFIMCAASIGRWYWEAENSQPWSWNLEGFLFLLAYFVEKLCMLLAITTAEGAFWKEIYKNKHYALLVLGCCLVLLEMLWDWLWILITPVLGHKYWQATARAYTQIIGAAFLSLIVTTFKKVIEDSQYLRPASYGMPEPREP